MRTFKRDTMHFCSSRGYKTAGYQNLRPEQMPRFTCMSTHTGFVNKAGRRASFPHSSEARAAWMHNSFWSPHFTIQEHISTFKVNCIFWSKVPLFYLIGWKTNVLKHWQLPLLNLFQLRIFQIVDFKNFSLKVRILRILHQGF